MEEVNYHSLISPIFFNKTSKCGKKYRATSIDLKNFNKENPTFNIIFENDNTYYQVKYLDIVNNNVEYKQEPKKVKKSKSKKIPSDQEIDLDACDKFVDIKICYDTREQSLEYLDFLTLDEKRKKDNTQIVQIERKCVKPLNCNASTGDITYEYRTGNQDWQRTNFAVEIKKGLDSFSTIFTTENYTRLMKELDRAVDAGLDFYYIVDSDLTEMVNNIKKLESKYVNGKFKKKQLPVNAHVIFLEKFLKLNEELSSREFSEVICAGKDMFLIIRRLIKRNLKKSLK